MTWRADRTSPNVRAAHRAPGFMSDFIAQCDVEGHVAEAAAMARVRRRDRPPSSIFTGDLPAGGYLEGLDAGLGLYFAHSYSDRVEIMHVDRALSPNQERQG